MGERLTQAWPAALLTVALAVLLPGPAHAAFPGQNGKIAFTKASDFLGANGDVYVMNPDGTGQTNLTEAQAGNAVEPAWSPDGSKIAYELFTQGSVAFKKSIWTMNADGSGKTEIASFNTTDGWPDGPAWSPDGTKIVFTRGICTGFEEEEFCKSELRIVNADGTAETSVPNVLAAENPAWSPDGETIAFTDCLIIDLCQEPELATVRVDGSDLRHLSDDLNYDFSADWSADGTRLISWDLGFASDVGIFTVNRDGSNRTYLGLQGRDPVWSPDGTRIAFGDYEGEIHTANPDGSAVVRITSGTATVRSLSPNWQPVPGPRPADYKNQSKFCHAERAFLGEQQFRARYGKNGNGANAFGKCVSGK